MQSLFLNLGAVNMTVMVQRSCLALGSLAKALRKSGNDTVASAILEHLHTWLYEQGDGNSPLFSCFGLLFSILMIIYFKSNDGLNVYR